MVVLDSSHLDCWTRLKYDRLPSITLIVGVIAMAYKPLRLAENIVLLRRRCNKPLPPTKNELPEDRDSLGRIFTLRQELDIVGCLTYLSAYSKESDRVTALCMEECADHNGLIVSFATNTGSTQHLLQGMQGIVELLEQQAKGSSCLYLLFTD